MPTHQLPWPVVWASSTPLSNTSFSRTLELLIKLKGNQSREQFLYL
uniref:Uncharacterized protein n=1 Tax=Rhizophora mucronata TaxID=61149 RepID=A0A2P2P2Y6_RHIMU